MTWQLEHTDTFGGEANYCWVHRETIDHDMTNLALVRKAKAFAGFTGLRCVVDNYGDSFTIRPVGKHAPCQIVFATWQD